MQILLKQKFTIGRFHATPWRAFPFDDPYGEWPPSPWRLLRAILARSFQLSRELYADEQQYLTDERLREQLVHAFCSSKISWRLPACSWRGPGIQQYQPSEFKKIPADGKKPGEKTYNTTKVKDNFWLTPENAEPLYWLLESTDNSLWENGVLPHLDECLARMTYFGRAESITCIERVEYDSTTIIPNCELHTSRTATTVPVLCPTDEATFTQVACSTDEKSIAGSTTPPGAVWKYAERPAVAKIIRSRKAAREFPPASIVQFAVGGRVFPQLKSWIHITEKFRGIMLRKITQCRTGDKKTRFNELPSEIRAEYSLLTGKDMNGKRLTGHRHAAFFLIPDRQGKPSRLICYRKQPFTSEEQSAMFDASETPLAWSFGRNDSLLRLVPLPGETPLPPDINVLGKSTVWETLTLYVPPLHVLTSNGKPKRGAEIVTQIAKHLEGFGLPSANVDILSSQNEPVQWVKVHRPRRSRDNRTNDDKRAYRIRLTFSKSVTGPLFLGHSSHFGLGLFIPVVK